MSLSFRIQARDASPASAADISGPGAIARANYVLFRLARVARKGSGLVDITIRNGRARATFSVDLVARRESSLSAILPDDVPTSIRRAIDNGAGEFVAADPPASDLDADVIRANACRLHQLVARMERLGRDARAVLDRIRGLLPPEPGDDEANDETN